MKRILFVRRFRHKMDKTKAAVAAIVIIISVIVLIVFVISTRNEPNKNDDEKDEIPLKLNITGDILDLTADTFQDVLKGNEYVLVEFCKYEINSHFHVIFKTGVRNLSAAQPYGPEMTFPGLRNIS